jgi:magnesium-transporting ATPase (P-type)
VCRGFATKAYRTLLVAYKDISDEEWEALKAGNNDFTEVVDRIIVESELTMVGIFALFDPLRPGIYDAVTQCHKSGINVRMCTGDSPDTAKAISLLAGIVTQEELNLDCEDNRVCMEGKEFRVACGGMEQIESKDGGKKYKIKSMSKFRRTVDSLKVLARSLPEDKLLLVTGLKEMGKVVAVTGDGTNDAPALASANIGFAMGITGSDVAKNAAAIVLTDDNFCSILIAVKYGRNIYDSVRKFL